MVENAVIFVREVCLGCHLGQHETVFICYMMSLVLKGDVDFLDKRTLLKFII